MKFKYRNHAMTQYKCPNCHNILFLNTNKEDNNKYWRCCKWAEGCKTILSDLENRPDFSRTSIKNSRIKMLIKLANKNCPICNRHLTIRKSNTTKSFFLGCTHYPECSFKTWTEMNEIQTRFITWL
jgi:ssDNA-binding Zn-finger/Zn-ribbon topoisomerase 1